MVLTCLENSEVKASEGSIPSLAAHDQWGVDSHVRT